ncbi:MAG: quinolinate synthase NadA [Planctomycetes bacterium]|nr:quinolinate synthase NadA [Planctomycetota bacterium]
MSLQVTLDPKYAEAPVEVLMERIRAVKKRLGKRLLILGHHYQCDEVIEFADITGDSFKLAAMAGEREEAEFIVFCGVHFMAESADILTDGKKTVILPDMGAGCSMADMADIDQTEEAWAALTAESGPDAWVPITYMNSSAAIKAFVGRHGGTVCTSSNAETVYRWALDQGRRILFLPDQHLGRNVGYFMGIPLDDMKVWDPHALADDNLDAGCDRAKVVLWKGHCSVHGRFLPEHVDERRAEHPGLKVIAHPECTYEVVQKADAWGSTEKIIRAVTDSPPGSKWAVGTEIHLVHRLAKQNPDKLVVSLSGIACLCSTMYRIDPPHLLWALEGIERGEIVNQIKVDAETAKWARVALDQMLALV